MSFIVKVAFKKVIDKENYKPKYDLCNHFNMANFNITRIPQLKVMFRLYPEETEKIICQVFEEWSYEWAFENETETVDNLEDIFLTNKRLDDIVSVCKIRCGSFMEESVPKSEKKFNPRITSELPEQIYGDIVTKTTKRSDGREIQISDKYFKRFAYPPNYRYDDIQNDKLPGIFKRSPMNYFARIDKDKGTGKNICSAVMIQPLETEDISYKAKSYYAVQHFKRGFELASERGTFDDESFIDIAKRTIIKELNLDCIDKMNISGTVVENGGSKIFLFTIVNFERVLTRIPIMIKDKNIIGSKFVKYSDLKPWSKFHINIFNGALSNNITK